MKKDGLLNFADLPVVKNTGSDKAIAIALSGGPDSMALCWLLSHTLNVTVHAITVDHGLRKDSASEAKRIVGWIKKWPRVKHVILKLKLGKTRIMEAAREERYKALASYCRKHKIRHLFVAHHQDDQAETFLFRLAKGSGLDGLAGISDLQVYDKNLTLVRPLLGVSKEEIISLCQKNKIPFVTDPSNQNTDYARPRLRAARAALEKEGLSYKRLAVTATRLRLGREALEHYTHWEYESALIESKKKELTFDYPSLAVAPSDIRLRVLLKAMNNLGIKAYGPRREKLEDLAQALFDTKKPFKNRTLGGFIFRRDDLKNRLVVEKENV